MFYEEVFRELNKSRVKYVAVGGLAVVLHGVVRATADLDLFVEFSEKNILKFVKSLSKLGYRPKIPVKASDFADASKRESWRKEKEMRVFSFFHLQRHHDLIDVLVYEPISFDKVYRARKIVNVGGIRIPIVSVKHLKDLKKLASRPQDLADIEALKQVQRLRKRDV